MMTGKIDGDAHATADPGIQLHLAAERLTAFTHHGKANAETLAAYIKALAIIADDDAKVLLGLHQHQRLPGAGIARDIGQPFLYDAIDVDLQVRHHLGELGRDAEDAFATAVRLVPLFNHQLQRLYKSQLIQHHRTQAAKHAAHVAAH